MSYLPSDPTAAISSPAVEAISPTEADSTTPGSATAEALVEIVSRACTGDMSAQTELVHLYTPRVAGLVRSILGNQQAVEDIVQTVFVKMVRALHRLRDPRVFEAWLFTMARNATFDFIRGRHRRPEMVSCEEQMLDLPDTSRPQAVGEIMEALDLALTRLKPRDRDLVSMIAQGHSYQAVAARVGLTTGALKVRLHRVRPLLRMVVGEAVGVETSATRNRRIAA